MHVVHTCRAAMSESKLADSCLNYPDAGSENRWRRWRLAAVVALCLACLSACSPKLTLPDVPKDVPSTWRNATQTHDDRLGPAPDLQSWWRALGDAQLDHLIDTALHDNLTVAQAGYRLQAARALAQQSKKEFRPGLSFQTLSLPEPSSKRSYFQAGFDAIWELGLFGRSRGSAEIAQADIGAAEVGINAARVSVAAEVARTYVELRAAQSRAAMFDQLTQLRQKKVDLAQVQLRTETGSALDLERARAELAQHSAQLVEPRQAIVQAQQALAVLLAQTEPGAEILAAAPQPVLADVAFAGAPADLLRTRPEIQRAEQDVLHAAGELGVAKADLYPKLALGGSLTFSTFVAGDIDRAGKGVPAIGPLIQMPLFDWGQRRDVVVARNANLGVAMLAYRQTVLEGIGEAESAIAQLENQRVRVTADEASLAALTASDRSVATLQTLGLADGTEVVTVQSGVLQARIELSNAQRDQALAYIAMYKAFGGAIPARKDEGAP